MPPIYTTTSSIISSIGRSTTTAFNRKTTLSTTVGTSTQSTTVKSTTTKNTITTTKSATVQQITAVVNQLESLLSNLSVGTPITAAQIEELTQLSTTLQSLLAQLNSKRSSRRYILKVFFIFLIQN